MSRTVLAAIGRRLPDPDDDRGSIPLLILVIVACAALGGLLMASVISQSQASNVDQARVRALDAAQSGIDVVLGKIRTATTTNGVGDDGSLPCTVSPGAANNTGSASYAVTIAYYTANPVTAGPTDLMLCTSAGPYNPLSVPPTRTPRYALITSTGYADAAKTQSRTIQTTYVFETNDVNISGGQIRIYPTGTTQYCMDAGSNPGVGTPVVLQACSTSNPPLAQQVWAYRSDLSIELVSTAKSALPLCIDTPLSLHTPGSLVVLNPCSVLDTSVCAAGVLAGTGGCIMSPWNQQWSVDDNGHLEGSLLNQSDIDGYCINAASQSPGVGLTLQSCAGGTTDTHQTWVPSPTTGAGMAGSGNNQLVNYQQFATCLDVTGQDPNSSFLILYTCKQNPSPSKVLWNQKFVPSPALGAGPTRVLLKVNDTYNSTTYCLRSPLTAGGYPVLSTPCPSSVATAAAAYVWTVDQKYTDTTQSTQLAYADKYTIKDGSGYCLGPGQNSDMYIGVYYKVVVGACNGSTAQKWNADPSLDSPSLTNTHEITTGGN